MNQIPYSTARRMLSFTANLFVFKASFTYHFRHTRLGKFNFPSILILLTLLSSQVAWAQCISNVTIKPGLCNGTTNTYSTTTVVTLSNPVAGVLTITDGVQSTTQITAATTSATFTASFTGLLSNGNSHTVVASLSNCNALTATYTAPGSCTQPAGAQLALTKLVDQAKAKIGNVMNYTLVLTNTGSAIATNVVVRDSMSTGLTFVTGSATVPSGTTLTQGTPVSAWKVASLSANQSFSLVYQATADSSGVLYNQATIPGDTATVCTSIPVLVCTGDVYVFRLTAKPGRSSYRWFKNDVELTTQTTNTLDITAPGTYSLAVDNVSGKCPDFSCCPFIVEEDTLPTFGAIATPATCVSNNAQSTGQIVLSNFRTGYTYQYSLGTDFNPAVSLSGPAKFIPVGGVIVNNLANPATAQSYTVRVYNASGCYTDVTAVLLPTVCCSVSLVATAGSCNPVTNAYSTTALISLTNPVAGTLTLSNGPKSLTFATTAGSSVTFAATFDNLPSDGTSHTIIASLPGCSTATATYTAPASCSAGLRLTVMDPGACQPETNTYTSTGVISLTNAVAGPVTITDGTSTTTLSISAGTSSVPYSMSGLPSGTGSHTVTVSYLGYTISATYTAPASCSVAQVCSTNTVITPGICASATNTYSATAVVTLSNPIAGLLTITTGNQSLTFTTTTGSSVTFTATFDNLISDGATHSVITSLPGCSTNTTAYTAPASCSTSTPVCSVSATASAGICNPATNTYSASVVVNLTNVQSGTVAVNLFGAASGSQPVASGTSSLTFVFPNISSDGATRTATISLPGCGTTTATFTAPASCSVAPACALSAVATAGVCASATNTYSASVVITLTNPTTGTVSVSNGDQTKTLLASPATTSLTATFANLSSDGAAHTVTVSLPGCSTTSANYTAPASCSVAPACALSAVATAGVCASATNTYSASVVITLTNPTTGTVSVSNGDQTKTLLASPATTSLTATFANLSSDGAAHTVTVSLPGCSTTSTTYTAPASCSATLPVVCSVSATASAGICNPATNTYSASVVVNLTNVQSGTVAVNLFGAASGSQPVASGTSSLTFVFPNISSDGATRTATISLPGCGTTTATFTAPASCSVAPACALSAVATAGVCSTATNTYSASVVITLTHPTTGTVSVSNGDQTKTLLASPATSSLTATFANLISDGAAHTVTVSLPGCGTTSANYTAPASCSVAPVCALSAVATAGVCASATNTYSASVVITLTNPTTGTVSVSNGDQTQTLLASPATTSLTATFANLISDGAAHAVTVSLPSCGTTSANYTAPASCSVAPACALSAVATAGVCSTATNTYSASVVITLTHPTTGTVSVSNGDQTQTLLASPATSSLTATFANLISDGAAHAVTVSLPGCSTTSANYTAPASCSVAPVCALSAVATAGVCASATNTYSASVVITLTNPTTGTVSVSNGDQTQTLLASPATTSLTATFANLISDGAAHTVTVSLPGCSTTTTTYTAPASCSVAPACALSAVATAGVCASATNTYSASVVITLTNPIAGTVSVSNGDQTQTLLASPATSSLTATFANLISDGAAHAVTVSLPGCSTTSANYTAPSSCSVGVGLAVTDPGICIPGINTYNTTGIISLTNAVAGSLLITDGASSITVSIGAGATSVPYSMSGLPSGTGLHTVMVSYLSQTASTTYTAPTSCSTACSLTAVATAIPVTCSGTMALQNGKIVISGFTTGDTYQYSGGVVFNAAVSLSGSAQTIPVGGLVVSNLANPASAQPFTIRIYSTSGCYKDSTVMLMPTVCTCPVTACVPLVVKQTKGVRRLRNP